MRPDSAPRLTAVMGVAHALLATLTPGEAAEVLLAEFGWDVSFQVLLLLPGQEARRAGGLVWESLLLDPLERELSPLWPV